jgi:hypothetical protein
VDEAYKHRLFPVELWETSCQSVDFLLTEHIKKSNQGMNGLILLCNSKKKSLEIQNGVIRIRISKKNRKQNGRKKKYKGKDKQRSTKHQWAVFI